MDSILSPTRSLTAIALGSALMLAACGPAASDKQSSPGAAVKDSASDANGGIHVPADYRMRYQGIGTWAVAAEKGPGSQELHVVYASPGTADAYRRTRHFPEGSVLVKEVYQTATAPMTTGTVSHAKTLKGWFVMVRAQANPHPGNKLWGDGWGWAWFDAGTPQQAKTTDYKAECLSCHEPARATELSYVEGYPAFTQ